MLKLKKYSFSGIGRFVKKQTINFEGRDHLIQIDGENTNTGGSSGAGKSTTVEALAYLLGISDISATQLQSRITKSPIWVQGKFEGGITITRSKKDGLTIETPEGTVSGNSKLAEEKLDEIIGVSRKLLKTMCYKRQKQGGFFLNLTPKESHNFLVECLGLKEYQNKTFKLEDTLKNKYKPRKLELETSIATREESISQLKTLLEEKKIPLRPELAYLDEQKAKLNIIDINLKDMKKSFDDRVLKHGSKPQEGYVTVFGKQLELDNLEIELATCQFYINENIQKHKESIEKINNSITTIESKIADCDRIGLEIDSLRDDIRLLLDTIAHLEKGDCPTCLREWQNEQKKEKLIFTNEEINVKKELIEKLWKEVKKRPTYEAMLKKAQEMSDRKEQETINNSELLQLVKLEEQVRILKNERDNIDGVRKQEYLEKLTKWQDGINMLQAAYEQQSNKTKEERIEVAYKIDRKNMEVEAYEAAMESYKTDWGNINDKLKESHISNAKDVIELEELEKNILLSEESIRLIKNFTLQKFNDTLEYIGERATEIINNVPNMANAVIFFDNAKETKSGKVKNEVNAVINLEGDTGVPIKTLSGGERTSADFAIDLAVSEMIELMTKTGVNFLIIDEGFDGLDSISKIECLEILKSLTTDKKILIVDHSSEVKEMVSDIIKVKRTNEESVIV